MISYIVLYLHNTSSAILCYPSRLVHEHRVPSLVFSETHLLLISGPDDQRHGQHQHHGEFPPEHQRYAHGRGERDGGRYHLTGSHAAGLRAKNTIIRQTFGRRNNGVQGGPYPDRFSRVVCPGPDPEFIFNRSTKKKFQNPDGLGNSSYVVYVLKRLVFSRKRVDGV